MGAICKKWVGWDERGGEGSKAQSLNQEMWMWFVVVEARPRRSAMGQCSTWGTGAFSTPYRSVTALDSSRAGRMGLPALQMR